MVASKIRELEDFFVPLLHKCVGTSELQKIHGLIIKHSLSQSSFLVTKMVDVCGNGGDVEYAGLLFSRVTEPNSFLYNSTIRAYTQNSMYSLAIEIYKQMLRNPEAQISCFPDRFTFPFVLKSCAGLASLGLGKQIHAHLCKFVPQCNAVIENALMDMYIKCDGLIDANEVFDGMSDRDVISWNSLVSGYARLGQMKKASVLFEQMPKRTIVSWTAMISGYTRIACYADALGVFRRMQMAGIEPDEISIISVLPACGQLGALELGKWIHIYSERKGLLKKPRVCNALIEMYAKSGCIDQSVQIFNQMCERDVISWSTMISGLASHGNAREAISLFQDMRKENAELNEVTFLGLLSACAHSGLWQEGMIYFDMMRNDYHMEPLVEHYGCLIDLLGRAGRLDQALGVIQKMPMTPDPKIWGSLLSCCRTYGNLEVAVTAMEHLLEVEPDDAGNYVLLSNIYADLGMWEGVSMIRKLIRSKRLKKTPGGSSIEVNNVVEEFAAGDESKPFWKEICSVLQLFSLNQERTNGDLVDDVVEEDAVSENF